VNPIRFHNRYTNTLETEKVYGEAFLKWAYGNPLGKIALHSFVKKPWFSRWYGRKMNHPKTASDVLPFIKDYDMDIEEFLDTPESFEHFNAFFYRKLKPEARAIHQDSVVFPADGRHLGFSNVAEISNFFVKGQTFNIYSLLDDAQLSDRFKNGALILSRLCPVDYHRFHFPCTGTANHARLINGPLFSVSPIALRKNLNYLWENKRTVTVINTPDIGQVAMLEIGATCVGSIHQTYQRGSSGEYHVKKGEEKGYFSFGGSSTITLFEPGKIELSKDLLEHTANQTELYARMGDSMGKRI